MGYENIETEIRNANFTRNNEVFDPIFFEKTKFYCLQEIIVLH